MIVLVIEVRGCHDRLHSNGAAAITSAENLIGAFIARTTRGTSLKSKVDNFRAYTHARRAVTGPCLTDAAPEAAPGELFMEEPLRGGSNINLSDRCGSLHRWVHVHLSTTHDGTLGIVIPANTNSVKVVPMMQLVKCRRPA